MVVLEISDNFILFLFCIRKKKSKKSFLDLLTKANELIKQFSLPTLICPGEYLELASDSLRASLLNMGLFGSCGTLVHALMLLDVTADLAFVAVWTPFVAVIAWLVAVVDSTVWAAVVTVVGSEAGAEAVLVRLLLEMELTTVVEESGGLAVVDSSPGSTTVVFFFLLKRGG